MYLKDIFTIYKLNILREKPAGFLHFKRMEKTALYFATRKEAEQYKQDMCQGMEASIEEKRCIANETNQYLIIKDTFSLRSYKEYSLDNEAINELIRHSNLEGRFASEARARNFDVVNHVVMGVKFHPIYKTMQGVEFSQDAHEFVSVRMGYEFDEKKHGRDKWWYSYRYDIIKLEKNPVMLTGWNELQRAAALNANIPEYLEPPKPSAPSLS